MRDDPIIAVVLERSPAWLAPVYKLIVERTVATWEGGPFSEPKGHHRHALAPHVFGEVVERVEEIDLTQWTPAEIVIMDMPVATLSIIWSDRISTGWCYGSGGGEADSFGRVVDHLDAIAAGFGWGPEQLDPLPVDPDRPVGVRPRPPSRPAPTRQANPRGRRGRSDADDDGR